MNNLVLTKKRIKKAERLHAARIATFKKGIFTSYYPTILKNRKSQAGEDISSNDHQKSI